MAPDRPPAVLVYFDVLLVLVAAPVMLLIGVPALGYLVGAGAWIALRGAGVAADRLATATPDAARQISAMAVILARQSSKNDGLAALVVIAAAFTISMAVLPATRPRKR
jgi:hypothetical protein